MHQLRFALSLGAITLFVAAAVIHPPVRELLLLASLLLAAESVLQRRALRAIRAAVAEMAEDHLEALALARVVQGLAREATTEEAMGALGILQASQAMERGTAKVMLDLAKALVERDMAAKAMAAKGASGD